MSVIYAARGAQTLSCVSSQSAHMPLERGSDEDRGGGSWVAQGSPTGVGVTVGKRTCSMWVVGTSCPMACIVSTVRDLLKKGWIEGGGQMFKSRRDLK